MYGTPSKEEGRAPMYIDEEDHVMSAAGASLLLADDALPHTVNVAKWTRGVVWRFEKEPGQQRVVVCPFLQAAK